MPPMVCVVLARIGMRCDAIRADLALSRPRNRAMPRDLGGRRAF